MKHSYLPVLFCLVSLTTIHSQVISVENTSYAYALPLVPNLLTIVVEDQPCDNIFAKTNNGTIQRQEGADSGCQFSFVPEKNGKAILKIYKIVKRDTILLGEREYKIRKWPEQKAKFANLESGSVGKGEFLANTAVVIPVEHMAYDANIPVKYYNIKVIRDGKLVLDLKNRGASLELQNHQSLEQVKTGDVVIFENIAARMPGEAYDIKMNDVRLVIQ